MASPKAELCGFAVNLRRILEDYAWKHYLHKLGWPRRIFARKHNHYFDMRWSYLNFDHKTEWSNWQQSPSKHVEKPADWSAPARPEDMASSPVVLHAAEYENRTPVGQKYTFSTTRETSASVSVEFQSNYSLGAETNIELKVPGDLVTVSAGVNGSLSVTETEGQSFQETHSWNVDTEIAVDAGHKTHAFLRVHENEVTAEFEVLTTMSLGKEWFPVMVRKRENDEVVHTVFVTSLKEVYQSHEGPNIKVEEAVGEDNRVSYNVKLTSRGRIKSVCWTEQEVTVRSELLPDLSPELKELINSKKQQPSNSDDQS